MTPSKIWITALTRKTLSGQLNTGPTTAFPSKKKAQTHCDTYLMARAREEFHLDALAADQRWYYDRK